MVFIKHDTKSGPGKTEQKSRNKISTILYF